MASKSTSTVNGETVTRRHEIVRDDPSWTECKCGHIFSGARTRERADEHVANPSRDDDLLNILLVRQGE